MFSIDETIERRWGSRISAEGIFRDAVRSTETHMVRASGLRWVSMMWLTQIPFCQSHLGTSRSHSAGAL